MSTEEAPLQSPLLEHLVPVSTDGILIDLAPSWTISATFVKCGQIPDFTPLTDAEISHYLTHHLIWTFEWICLVNWPFEVGLAHSLRKMAKDFNYVLSPSAAPANRCVWLISHRWMVLMKWAFFERVVPPSLKCTPIKEEHISEWSLVHHTHDMIDITDAMGLQFTIQQSEWGITCYLFVVTCFTWHLETLCACFTRLRNQISSPLILLLDFQWAYLLERWIFRSFGERFLVLTFDTQHKLATCAEFLSDTAIKIKNIPPSNEKRREVHRIIHGVPGP